MASSGTAPRPPRPANDPIIFHIEVTSGEATVMATDIANFVAGDYVQFSSNDDGTAIQFVEKSPFAHPAPGEVFPVGRKCAVLPVVNVAGICQFLCGQVVSGGFIPWGSQGSHTPKGG